MGLYRYQNYSQSDIIPEMPGNTYGITGLQNGSAWGIRGVLEQLDPSNVMKLVRIIVKPYTIDRAQTIGDVQVTNQPMLTPVVRDQSCSRWRVPIQKRRDPTHPRSGKPTSQALRYLQCIDCQPNLRPLVLFGLCPR